MFRKKELYKIADSLSDQWGGEDQAKALMVLLMNAANYYMGDTKEPLPVKAITIKINGGYVTTLTTKSMEIDHYEFAD